MKINAQKFMKKQALKWYTEELQVYLSVGFAGSITGLGEKQAPKQPPFMCFEEWLKNEGLTEGL